MRTSLATRRSPRPWVVRTLVRLQKLDFWVRNPDYLANELLNDFENGDQDLALLAIAGEILDSEEPELRRRPTPVTVYPSNRVGLQIGSRAEAANLDETSVTAPHFPTFACLS